VREQWSSRGDSPTELRVQSWPFWIARTVLTVLFLSLLTVTAGRAAEDGTEKSPEKVAAAEEAPFRWTDLGIKGKLTLKNFSHFHETPTDNRNFREEGILELEWARRLAAWSSFKIVAVAREDDDRFAQGVSFRVPDTSERRSTIDVKETVLKLDLGPASLAFGKQIFAWGTADAYNPTDNINPYDYLDVIDREKLGVYSGSLGLTAGPVDLTFVLVPLFTPSRDPLAKSRWTPIPEGATSADIEAGRFGVSIPKGALIEERRIPPNDVDNMQYAARLKTTVGGWDVSGSYYEGFEHTPVAKRPRTAGEKFVPVYTRMKVAGLDFSTTYEKFEFHGEGAFKFEERDGKDDRFQGILGLNYTWDDLGLKWLEHIMFIVEHARETNLSSRSRSRYLEAGAFTNAFRDALAGRVRFKFNEETQFSVGGTMDFTRDPNYYVQFKLNHKITDAVHIETGLEFFDGDRDNFWGRWRDNDRFFFFLKYFF
jgi:hypothetical protein